jgi:hypothetical protein
VHTDACHPGRHALGSRRVLQADHLSPCRRVLTSTAFQRRIRGVQAPDDTVRLGVAAGEGIRAGTRCRRATPAAAAEKEKDLC